jgi:phosphatidylglycerophosphate synthase
VVVVSHDLILRLRESIRQDDGGQVFVAASSSGTPAGLPHGTVLAVSAATLAMVAESASPEHGPLEQLLHRAAQHSRLRMIAELEADGVWYRDLRNAADVAEAESRLFAASRSRYDGFIDRYFNRRLSAPMTRLCLKAGLTANMVTIVSIMIGLLAAVAFSLGTYAGGILGGVLFQFAAVIDCCDGEIARLTFSESRIGRQLDILGDNVVHMAIFAALGWAGFHHTGSWLPLALAVCAIVGNALSLVVVLRADARRVRQQFAGPVQAARVNLILKNAASRDFSVVVLAFAVLNLLPGFLWLAAVGSNVFWLVTAWVLAGGLIGSSTASGPPSGLAPRRD